MTKGGRGDLVSYGREAGSEVEGLGGGWESAAVSNAVAGQAPPLRHGTGWAEAPRGWDLDYGMDKGEGVYNVVVIGAGTAGLVTAGGAAGLGGRGCLGAEDPVCGRQLDT